MDAGIHRISEIPEKKKPKGTAARQIRSMNEKRMIIESTLEQALEPFDVRLGFLDFETIARAAPVWPGMTPWEQAAAQFSYHETNGDHTDTHAEFFAEGPNDARPLLAQRMIEATASAERVVTYSAFEKSTTRAVRSAEYCKRDTWAMVRLLENLRALA